MPHSTESSEIGCDLADILDDFKFNDESESNVSLNDTNSDVHEFVMLNKNDECIQNDSDYNLNKNALPFKIQPNLLLCQEKIYSPQRLKVYKISSELPTMLPNFMFDHYHLKKAFLFKK